MVSTGEAKIAKILLANKIEFEREKTFSDLKRKGFLRFDFYCPNINSAPVIIEYDGEYHFQPIRGRQAMLKQQEYDRRKNSYCLANEIKLIRIPFWELNNINFEFIFNTPNFVVVTKWHNDNLKPQ